MVRIKKEGLSSWKGETKDSFGCIFPYEVYQNRYYLQGELITERLYICPWYEDHKFTTLNELKAFISNIGNS